MLRPDVVTWQRMGEETLVRAACRCSAGIWQLHLG